MGVSSGHGRKLQAAMAAVVSSQQQGRHGVAGTAARGAAGSGRKRPRRAERQPWQRQQAAARQPWPQPATPRAVAGRRGGGVARGCRWPDARGAANGGWSSSRQCAKPRWAAVRAAMVAVRAGGRGRRRRRKKK